MDNNLSDEENFTWKEFYGPEFHFQDPISEADRNLRKLGTSRIRVKSGG